MWKINNKEVKGKVVLAPMAGYTSSGYRKFYEPFGVAFSYTEMISDMGLIYNNQETLDYLPKKENNIPLGVQLFGSSVETLVEASKIVVNKCPFIDFIDINMACPVPKVNKTGAGCSLMKDPKLCGEIVSQIKKETGKEVSVKIRLGLDDKNINYLEVINEVSKAGASFVAIHARTKKQLYYGQPNYEIIRDLRKKMSIPLIISGNIFSVDDAVKALEITGADAVMVARGGIGNPFLISQINSFLESNVKLTNPSLKEQIDFCLKQAQLLIEEKGEEKAMRIYRSIAPKYFSGYINVKKLNLRLSSEITTYQSMVDIINDYLNENYNELI